MRVPREGLQRKSFFGMGISRAKKIVAESPTARTEGGCAAAGWSERRRAQIKLIKLRGEFTELFFGVFLFVKNGVDGIDNRSLYTFFFCGVINAVGRIVAFGNHVHTLDGGFYSITFPD